MIRAKRIDDFTGGLNLDTNSFRIDVNESNDLLNVDLNPKGGVSSRWGFRRIHGGAVNSYSAGSFSPMSLHYWSSVDKYIMLSANNKVFWNTGVNNFTDLAINTSNQFGAKFANWNADDDKLLYIARGASYVGSKWTGAGAVTNLTSSDTGAWQEEYTTSGTHMPRADLICTHGERLWVANVTEGSSTYPNRIRFSHPLFPERWRSTDYIDIVGGGDRITGIVSFGGHLIVFKPKAVFAVYGYSEDTFQVVELSSQIGAVSPNAIAVGDNAIYFYCNSDGLYEYTSSGIKDVFRNIRPLVIGSEINEASISAISVGYANNRVYLSLPIGVEPITVELYDSAVEYDSAAQHYNGGTQAAKATVSFVYDRNIGRGGAWTLYRTSDGYGLVTPIEFTNSSGVTTFVAAHPYQPYVLSIDQRLNGNRDNFLGSYSTYESYFKTGWEDGSNASSKKFWRRPEFILRQENDGTSVTVDVYNDWDGFTETKTFEITQDAVDVSTETWETWLTPDLGSAIIHGQSLGIAKSVQLKFYGNGLDAWSLYAMIYKYNPRKTKI